MCYEGMARVARETGLGRESLYKSLSPGGNPEFGTVLKVVRALGLQLRATVEGEDLRFGNGPARASILADEGERYS